MALVSGGGRGIGRAVALGLAADGADMAISYRRDVDAAAETVAGIEELGRRAVAHQGSIDSWEGDEALVRAVTGKLGPVDILVNNVGVAGRGQTVADTDPAEPGSPLAYSRLGRVALSKLVLPAMHTRPRGDIVMISSAATVSMAPSSAPYNIAKNLSGWGRWVGDRSRLAPSSDKPKHRFSALGGLRPPGRSGHGPTYRYLTGQRIGVDGGPW